MQVWDIKGKSNLLNRLQQGIKKMCHKDKKWLLESNDHVLRIC